MPTEIKNARISGTSLGREDHGIMTAFVTLDGDSWGVGFGGYAFDQYNRETKQRVGHGYGIDFILAVLDVVGVDSWEKLKGQHVRVEFEGLGGRALRLGHITKEKWFDPRVLSEKHFGAEAVR